MAAETLRLSPNSTLEVVSSDPELLVVEATYEGGGDPPPSHYHPSQDEHFEILEGRMQVVMGGAEETLATGDGIDIARGTPHQMWNPTMEPARVRWETRPAGRTEDFFRAVSQVMPAEGGMPDLEPMLEILKTFDDTFRLEGQ